jgi:hypothetical protein
MRPTYCLICKNRLGTRNNQNNIHKGCAKKFKHCQKCRKYIPVEEPHVCGLNILRSLFSREIGLKHKVEKAVKLMHPEIGFCNTCNQTEKKVVDNSCKTCHILTECEKVAACMICDELVCGCGSFSTFQTCYFCGTHCCKSCNISIITKTEILNCHILDCQNCILEKCVNNHTQDVCNTCSLSRQAQ